jgi:hypothetical protein
MLSSFFGKFGAYLKMVRNNITWCTNKNHGGGGVLKELGYNMEQNPYSILTKKNTLTC